VKAIAMGLVDKIVSKALGRTVFPGEIVVVNVDALYAHDGTAHLVVEAIDRELETTTQLKLRDSAHFFIDHAAPAPHIAVASVHKLMREFSAKYNVRLFEAGWGICHQVVVEEGLVRPGMIVIATDSHAPTIGAFGVYATGVGSTDAAIALVYGETWLRVPETHLVRLTGHAPEGVTSKDIALYVLGEVKSDGMLGKVVEYRGDFLKHLSMDSRMTLTNMSTEMGAESAIMPVDEVTREWLASNGYGVFREVEWNDPGEFGDELVVEVNRLEPLVAEPPDVDNVKAVTELEGIEVDQVFVGSCTNGRLEDIKVVASMLKGKKVRVRCIVIPASRKVYLESIRRGYAEILLRAGCIIGPPTCGPCVGAHMGILAEGEVAVSTSNRNFPGRMGHKDSKVYLASPAVAAATAIEGKIADPRKHIHPGC